MFIHGLGGLRHGRWRLIAAGARKRVVEWLRTALRPLQHEAHAGVVDAAGAHVGREQHLLRRRAARVGRRRQDLVRDGVVDAAARISPQADTAATLTRIAEAADLGTVKEDSEV